VIAQAHQEVTASIRARIAPLETNWEQILAGCQAYLEIAQQEELRRLLFVEAPAVLAVDTLVAIDQAGFHLLREAIQKAVEEGVLVAMDSEGFAHLLNGSLSALAAWVAQSADPHRLAAARTLVATLLERHRR
jgi:hypothetical protein